MIAEVPDARTPEPVLGSTWMWRWHLLSTLVLLVVWGPVLAKTHWCRRRLGLDSEVEVEGGGKVNEVGS
jgi:hypothetical protein